MSDKKNLKEDLLFIQKSIFKMGRNRKVALPVHNTWLLTDELEERIARVIKEVEKLEK